MAKFGWATGIILVILIGSLLTISVSTLANSHFTSFNHSAGFQFQDKERNIRFSRNGCTGRWVKKETYLTEKSRRYVWDSLSEIWGPRTGRYSLLQEEALYIEESLNAIKIQSKISYDSYPRLYTVQVTNEIAIQFPKRICEAGNRVAQLGR